MLKGFGCIMIICATSLWGKSLADKENCQYLELRYLQKLICILQNEIRYSRTCLEEIFECMGKQLKAPYSQWLLNLSKELKRRSGGEFSLIWEESIRKSLGEIQIPEREIQRLEQLGREMGLADIEVQNRLFELYLIQLEEAIEEKNTERKTKVKLCYCMGIFSGMFLAILLI